MGRRLPQMFYSDKFYVTTLKELEEILKIANQRLDIYLDGSLYKAKIDSLKCLNENNFHKVTLNSLTYYEYTEFKCPPDVKELEC